jgi:hypothetical protein
MSKIVASAAFALALALTGAVGPAASAGPLAQCTITAERQGALLVVSGVVNAEDAISGSYTLVVSQVGGGGSANVRQSGNFETTRGASILGTVMVGGGSAYDATLKVKVDGTDVTCRERIGGGQL